MNKKEEFIKNYIRNIAQQEILKDKIEQIKINSKFDEIKQAINALVQLAVYYNVETELEESIDRSLAKMKDENLL